ncbi:hypothetical protein GCM10027445_15410 [Amycolatopsis endophytica]|uniref:Uncharacterized protein n=1 Tax=Amycolatopsis endophytica TaxID=860233 RepID=A0A853B649_9PSEU|nr:hypothetical protein [Amycolatopsis endophytica]NYI90244.1 hypothetical protein [Amycolatopsis endophytica]
MLATEPGQAATALETIETAGRDTMTELRNLLDVLAPPADGDEQADLSPQPRLSRLSPLIDRIAFSGLPVELRVSASPGRYPPAWT